MIKIVNAIVCRNGQILMARRSKHQKTYPNKWSFPGGHVEQGETLDAALKRELQEELSVTPVAFSLFFEIDDPNVPANTPTRYFLFLVTAWDGGEPLIMDKEHSEISWMSAEAAGRLENLALSEYHAVFHKLSAEW